MEKMQFKDPCFYCKRDMRKTGKTFDHIIPVSKGGKNKGNIVRCCPDCNQFKSNKDLPDWLAEIQRLLDAGLSYKSFSPIELINIKKSIRVLMQPKSKTKKSRIKEPLLIQLKLVTKI